LTSGAVGIGIFPQFEEVVHEYEGLESISDTLQVTRFAVPRPLHSHIAENGRFSSQGNLVHGLDGSNPSKLLASFINAQSSEATLTPKDEDFYLGLLSEDGQVRLRMWCMCQQLTHLWTSGLPKSTPSYLATHRVVLSPSMVKKAQQRALK